MASNGDQPDGEMSVANERDLQAFNRRLRDQTQELQKLNRELTDNEQRLRLAIETGRIGLWVWNSTDVANSGDWSPRLKEIFGLPPETEVTHELFLKCVHAEDRERVNRAVMDALAGVNGGHYKEEYRTVDPTTGSVHWVTARAQAFFAPDGKPFRFIGTLMEISDRKQVEEVSLRMNRELEQRIVERTKDLREANTALQKEIQERANLAEALRVSEQFAQGQLNTLKEILGSLSTERNPNNLLQHVLCAILRQMAGQSVSVFSRNEDDTISLEVVYENGEMQVPKEKFRHSLDDQPLHLECMASGKECMITEFDRDPVWLRFVNRPNHDGIPRINEKTLPSIIDMHKRLKARGVVISLMVPMVTSGRVSGMIGIRYHKRREFLPEEIDLSLALAQQAALAMQVMRLSRESRQTAIASERNRMARDIHDTLAQGFTGIIAQLQAAKGAVDLNEAASHIERAENLARLSLDEARRSVRALRPRSLEATSLGAALEGSLRTMASYSGLSADFQVQGNERSLSPEREEALLRIAQESLTNTIKHAKAVQFRSKLVFGPDQLRLELSDDGVGFDVTAKREGFGLIGMKERVDQMGGEFFIRSRPGHGTETVIIIPCAQNPEAPML
jgi:PAS domain S-box-containing protein